MIKDLWDIGKDIFSLTDTFKAQKKEKRESLSKLLDHIGNVLKDTFDKLSHNIYPGGNCEQLELFSKELYIHMKDIIGDTKADILAKKLEQAHKVEKLFYDLQNGKIDSKELKLLDEASGRFIATSKLLLL